jgi:Glycosyl hydrolase family 10
MGVMTFQIPGGTPAETVNGLTRACLGGGYDHTPVPCKVEVRGDRLILKRDRDESGFLMAPWKVEGAGLVLGSSPTLMERITPYHLVVELGRGKLNQVRCQTADWELAGLELSTNLRDLLHRSTHALCQGILDIPRPEAQRHAQTALALSYQAAEEVVGLYTEQLFGIRHQRQEKLDSLLGCRLGAVPPSPVEDQFRSAFNAVCVPMNWRTTEPAQSNYNWEAADAVVAWADERALALSAGPLIDFSTFGLPDWLLPWEGDLPSLASFMCDYIETAVARYRDRIRRWTLCTGSNNAGVLSLGEDDLIRLTARLAEAAWGIDTQLELVIGLAQPWGDYLVSEEHTYSPFVFADTLLRAGLSFAAFDLEWFMGVSPRGTYFRDLLEGSRLLDVFGLLGVPIQLTLSYPASTGVDPAADPRQQVGSMGHFRDGLRPESQAEWAELAVGLALAKPHVGGVFWDHFIDSAPHRIPNGGLIDSRGTIHPTLELLRNLRRAHLQ